MISGLSFCLFTDECADVEQERAWNEVLGPCLWWWLGSSLSESGRQVGFLFSWKRIWLHLVPDFLRCWRSTGVLCIRNGVVECATFSPVSFWLGKTDDGWIELRWRSLMLLSFILVFRVFHHHLFECLTDPKPPASQGPSGWAISIKSCSSTKFRVIKLFQTNLPLVISIGYNNYLHFLPEAL